ncbi:MAG: arginine--tRNA ligase [Ruminococcaceae bacterium]|jgi:arginyl-tRNA synthetase|nr:arginine--tRNA ligase [Oscillospiraceae bacterium]
MQNFKKKTAEAIENAVLSLSDSAGLTAADIESFLEYPPDPAMGDLAFPCFRLSKALRNAPPKIAAALAESLKDFSLGLVEAVGGYLNFKVSPDYLSNRVLGEIEEKGASYGSSDIGRGKVVTLDYSSPNICKPFHIGHLGTTVIGHSLKLLHEFAGYTCIGINHLGDWGTQFGKQIVAFRKWGDRETVEKIGIDELVRLYVKFHEEAEKDPALEDEARAEFHKLEEGDPDNLALWQWFVEVSLAEYKKTYRQLGIEFDHYTGESFYIRGGLGDKVIGELREKNLLKLDNGAYIVDLSDYNMPPCIIVKTDGSTIYHTRDIAAALYRKKTYDFDKSIYVTSSQQSLHFAQLFKVIELMGYPWHDRLVHVPYGTVSVDGAKLATRTGNVVLLKDLFRLSVEKVTEVMNEKNPDLENREEVAEAVGVGAIVFNYLYNSRIKDINFTLDQALSFEGSTGPYAQYTYARTCSILEKAGSVPSEGGSMTHASEAELLKTLSLFPEKVSEAIAAYEPSVITRYVIDVCTAFNHFYRDCPIVTADTEDAKTFRLRLTNAAKTVLGSALRLICMKTPEKI